MGSKELRYLDETKSYYLPFIFLCIVYISFIVNFLFILLLSFRHLIVLGILYWSRGHQVERCCEMMWCLSEKHWGEGLLVVYSDDAEDGESVIKFLYEATVVVSCNYDGLMHQFYHAVAVLIVFTTKLYQSLSSLLTQHQLTTPSSLVTLVINMESLWSYNV